METHPSTLKPRAGDSTPWQGLALAAGGLAVAAVWLYSNRFGYLLMAGLGGGAALAAAFRQPILLVAALWLAAPFNYGWRIGGGVLKISEMVTGLMLVTALLRLACGDRECWGRLRCNLPVLTLLGLLGLLAVATAAPHPNSFNVRYEIQNEIALAFGVLFFRRRHWPLLAGLCVGTLAIETAVALSVRFGLGLTGLSFAGLGGGIERVVLTSEDLQSIAGGLFRISGTFGHKNLLAAYFVLLLPLATLELLRRPQGRLAAILVLGPALATLALSDSMTGWGACAVMLVIALAHLRRFDYLAAFFLLLAPAAALALYVFGGSVLFRIGQVTGGGEAGFGTVSSRLELLGISGRLISEHPWFGIGRNNFMEYGQTYYTHAHNMFVMKMIEMGVPGGLMFLVLIAGVLARSWKPLATEADRLGRQGQYYRYLGLWLGCLGFTAMNLLDYNYFNFSLGSLYMLMLGLLLAMAGDEVAAPGIGGPGADQARADSSNSR